MKKKWMRMVSSVLIVTMLLGSAVNISAAAVDGSANASASRDEDAMQDANAALQEGSEAADGSLAADGTNSGADTDLEKNPDTDSKESSDGNIQTPTPGSDAATGDGKAPAADTNAEADANTETETTEQKKDVSGTISLDKDADGNDQAAGTITMDQNDDKVEIKKDDKPYLALGADLSEEQKASVLSMMGVDAGRLEDYDVVYVSNSDEHQYLGSYIDSGKIGTKSLSSIVIIKREKGNGIRVSTNNITYCSVGMYKNALATAGIQDADIIVAGPFPISGTAALVGVFKAYTQMTGDQIDEESIDAAVHELVITGELEASSGDGADDIERMMAYVKQSVVEHDLSDESEIRQVMLEGCEKFGIALTEDEQEEVVKLMQKIGELDLDLDSLLNAAQSIYDKISTADGGFWAKIRELLLTLISKVKELF